VVKQLEKKIIHQKINELENNLKEGNLTLEDLQDEIELAQPYNETIKIIESMGLKTNDFIFSGWLNEPYRFCSGVTWTMVGRLSKDYLEFMELNKRRQEQLKYAEACLLENDFDAFFFFLDKPIVITALEVFYEYIPSEKKYTIFREQYARMEYNFRDHIDFINLVIEDRFESNEWKEAIQNLKEKVNGKKLITIYRGEGEKSTHYEDAFSWTIDKKVATFFANRFRDKGKVYKAQVKIDDIIDYLDGRSESEVLVRSKNLQNITRVK
jgi:hypothetical protein